MSNLVIAAIPAEDDYIHKISSEKVPHMTLLFLGDVDKVQNFSKILDFIGHAAKQSLNRFGLEVDRRGKLGPDQADVLFFSKSKWSGFDQINSFRSFLLQDNNVRAAYESTEQFPEWLPHITLGYPKTPAKPDNRDYPGINHVRFDRIAIWFADFKGIEIPLKTEEWDLAGDMALGWSSTPEDVVADILSHYGVLGMKWGKRGSRPSAVTVADKGKKIKTSGGHGRSAHPDAVRARTQGRIARSSGLKALSDKELQDYAKRLQSEASVRRLEYGEKNIAQRFVATLLGKSPNISQADSAAMNTGKKAVKLALA